MPEFKTTEQSPKVYYNDIVDPEGWDRKVIPAFLRAFEELDALEEARKGA